MREWLERADASVLPGFSVDRRWFKAGMRACKYDGARPSCSTETAPGAVLDNPEKGRA